MSNSEAVAEKIRRLRNERRNLILEIEEVKKQADSEATALESEVSTLREELRIEELKKLPDSEATALESEVSTLHAELEELKKLPVSRTAALVSELNMLREDVRVLRMDLPPREPEEEADDKKRPWWHFFR